MPRAMCGPGHYSKSAAENEEELLEYNYKRILKKWDEICRNVLIYFSTETKLKVLRMLHNSLHEDGVLLLGSCENIMSEQSGFVSCPDMYGVYRKGP